MLENFQLKSILMIMFLFFAAGTVYCQQFGNQVILIQLILRCDRNYNWLDILFYEFLLSLQSTFICCLELLQNNKLKKSLTQWTANFIQGRELNPYYQLDWGTSPEYIDGAIAEIELSCTTEQPEFIQHERRWIAGKNDIYKLYSKKIKLCLKQSWYEQSSEYNLGLIS